MAVSSILSQRDLNPITLHTEATLTIEDLSIKSIHLSITGQVEGIDADEFDTITKDAEKTCLISKILNIPISSESHFTLVKVG
jgi:osmotically inducible protein OsmC